MIITEPKWKSWIVETTTPLFTPDQCRQVIECGRRQKPQKAQVGMGKPGGGLDTKKRVTTISWIPFKEMPEMYKDINKFIQKANRNHFGFGDIQITEQAQFTEYPEGGFYDWHMDLNAFGQTGDHPIRKISMTCLLSDPADFSGGDLAFDDAKKKNIKLTQGQAIFFASFMRHRVEPVKKGVRHSLVMWFGGPPFK